MKKIGCFHAHHSNIEHIEQALGAYEVELIHFVDPGLDRIKTDTDFNLETAEKKVIETLDWIAKCHVDAILITCTFFTAVFRDDLHRYPIPVIKIDIPLFQEVCRNEEPKIFVFTNPNTVQGTLEQLSSFSERLGKKIQVEAMVLDHTFELIMQGKKEAYIAAVSMGLSQIAADNPDKLVIAAQLSMVPAARQVEQELDRPIGNPLDCLAGHMKEVLSLTVKTK